MTDTNHILFAYTVKGDGSGVALQGDDISKQIKAKNLAWVHMDATNPDTRKWLEAEVSYLDSIILDALLADETRPRIMEFESGTLLILRGVNLNDNADPEDMVSVRLWIDESRIISLQRRQLKSIADIAARFDAGTGAKNAGDFLVMLSSRLFERMEPVFTDLDERLDAIEEAIMELPDIKERKAATDVRKQAIVFRRYVAPQRDVMAHLRSSEQSWLNTTHKRQIQESQDRLIRYVEDLETIRERAQIVKDELASTLSDKMNKNLYLLSIIAAIFMPLGFLTGLFGINLGGLPGVDWPYAFTVFCVILVLFLIGQIYFFMKKGWF